MSGARLTERMRTVDLAAKSRLPAVFHWREFVEAGGLMSYGANSSELFRRAAVYVDKILKGHQASRSSRRAPEQGGEHG